MAKRAQEIIRVGIAGQGRSGHDIHAEWLGKAKDRYRVVSVADQIAERRADAERELGATAYADYREMIAAGGIDLFVNALPTPLHVPATIEAFQAGLHVVCEKPAAPTVKELDRMAAAAKRAGRVLAPFQNNRLAPFFVKMREVIDSGVLGDIIHIRSVWGSFARRWDWQTYQCNFGGALYNTGPHSVDHAVVLFGEREEPKVFCTMESRNVFGGDADDHCALTIHGSRSPTIEILITGYLAYPQGETYSVLGTRGGLTGSATRLSWRYFDPARAPRQKVWKRWSEDRAYPSERLPWVEKTWEVDRSVASGKASGYTLPSYEIARKLYYDNVHDVLCGRGELVVTLAQVRRQIAIIEEAHRQNPLPRRYDAWVPGKGPVRVTKRRAPARKERR